MDYCQFHMVQLNIFIVGSLAHRKKKKSLVPVSVFYKSFHFLHVVFDYLWS